jgi:uncharacterized protein (DUF2267 family)
MQYNKTGEYRIAATMSFEIQQLPMVKTKKIEIMSLEFEKHAATGNEFVRLVTNELNVPRDMAERMIRAVLHALRNNLSHEESFQLIAQLPMALKGVYVDGWNFDKDSNRIKHVEDFPDEVRKEDSGSADIDFGNSMKTRASVAAVMKALSHFVSEEKMDDIIDALPVEIRGFISKSLKSSEPVL